MENYEAGRIFGYAKEYAGHLGTSEQIRMLKKYVPENDLVVERPGRDTNAELQALKQSLHSGDTLYAVSLVCFSMRSNVQIKELMWMQRHHITTRFPVLPSTMSASNATEQWTEQRISTTEAIRRSGLKRSTFYNIANELSLSLCNSKPAATQTAALATPPKRKDGREENTYTILNGLCEIFRSSLRLLSKRRGSLSERSLECQKNEIRRVWDLSKNYQMGKLPIRNQSAFSQTK